MRLIPGSAARENKNLAPARHPRSRRLLSLKYTQRAAMEHIADETGQSFEAVKKALIRLRAVLLECMRRRLSQEEWNP